METKNFDEGLATQALAILSKQVPEDTMLQELSQLIQSSIAEKGRGTESHPSTAAVLEERINLSCLSTRQKLDQSRDIILFLRFFTEIAQGIPSPLPSIVEKAGALVPGFDEFLAPSRMNLN